MRNRHAGSVTERNVLGGELELCGTDPITGFFRDGCCIGNDLSTPRPEYQFPGLVPGDRWCVTALNWARAHRDGVAAPVVLAATNQAVLRIIPLAVLQGYAVDVPADPSSLEP